MESVDLLNAALLDSFIVLVGIVLGEVLTPELESTVNSSVI